MMENKPLNNWVETLLSDVVYFQEGPGLRTSQMGKEGIPFLNIRTFNDDETLDKSKCKFVKLSEFKNKYEHFLLSEGDIVVSSSGTLGKAIVIRNQDLPVMLNTSVIRFRVLSEEVITQDFLKYFLKSDLFFKQIQEQKTGMAIDNYGPSHLQLMKIVIPPLNEQNRIVNKLDSVLQKLDLNKARLDSIPRLLKRFRQSVLSAAVNGKLTEDWREKTGNTEDWSSVLLGDTLNSLDQGWSPKCENFPSTTEINWGVIKTTAVQHMSFLENENKQLPTKLSPEPKFELKVDDVLITRAGPRIRVGVCCHIKKTRNKLMICDKVYRLRANKSKILPGYIEILLNTAERIEEIEAMKTGISDSGVNLTQAKIKAIEFLKPSIIEQTEIVNRVKKLFLFADKLESRYAKAKGMIEKIPLSILAKAFRGELVPQDPSDEPASVLLEKIKEEKEKLAGIKMTKKTDVYKLKEKPLKIAADKKGKYKKVALK